MDQFLVAMLCLAGILIFVSGYYIGMSERDSRRSRLDVHSGPDDLEKRSRRAF